MAGLISMFNFFSRSSNKFHQSTFAPHTLFFFVISPQKTQIIQLIVVSSSLYSSVESSETLRLWIEFMRGTPIGPANSLSKASSCSCSWIDLGSAGSLSISPTRATTVLQSGQFWLFSNQDSMQFWWKKCFSRLQGIRTIGSFFAKASQQTRHSLSDWLKSVVFHASAFSDKFTVSSYRGPVKACM